MEVWVEKEAMAGNVRKALSNYHVVIAPNKGNNSIPFIHENIERLINQFLTENREKIWILYLGDLDPVGWNMDRLIKEDLARQTAEVEDNEGNPATPRFGFKRIGITMEQIKKHKLTHLMHPDKETLEKFQEQHQIRQSLQKRIW